MTKKNKIKYNDIVKDIVNNEVFLLTKNDIHHGSNKYDHLIRVSKLSYTLANLLNLDVVSTTRGAILHDFFTDEVKECGFLKRLQNHPRFALENAKKYYPLSPMQEDIILTHMFPVTFTPPKYLESWIVDLVDDGVAVYEKVRSTKKELRPVQACLFLLSINFFKLF